MKPWRDPLPGWTIHAAEQNYGSMWPSRALDDRENLAQKPKPPSRAVLASWVELLNSQAGGGHYYEDVENIFTRQRGVDNKAKVLANCAVLSAAGSMASQECVRMVTIRHGFLGSSPKVSIGHMSMLRP